MPNRSKGRGQTKSDPTGPPGWGLGRGLISLFRKKRIITETRSRVNSLFQRGTVAVPYRRELMTHGSQSQQDASGLIKSLIHPKYTMKIGNWNMRNCIARGRLEVVGGGADCSNQSRGVEKLCEGPMCHEARRG